MYDFKEVCKYSKDLTILYVEDDKDLMEETCDLLEDFFDELSGGFSFGSGSFVLLIFWRTLSKPINASVS